MSGFERKSQDATGSVETGPKFVAANGTPSDPVGHIGDDWGFWNEVWADWYGGYADEASARAGLEEYCKTL
jgi:hypothetical protein